MDIAIMQNLAILLAVIVLFALFVWVMIRIELHLRRKYEPPTQQSMDMNMEAKVWKDINEIVGRKMSHYD